MYHDMCMKCHKAVATVKITKIINGKPNEIHLCQECASNLSPYQKKMSAIEQAWNQILSQLLNTEKEENPPLTEPSEPKERIDAVCENCGFPYETYRQSFFLGCSVCYQTFQKYIMGDIRKIHGGTQHVGRVPARYNKIIEIRRNLEGMRRELQDAVKMENFERAAVLRDQIRAMSGDESSGDIRA